MRRRSIVVTAALAVGLALGLVLGPTLSASPASAQSASEPTAGDRPLWNTFLDQLAAALNIQRSTLDAAIVSAGTDTLDAAVQQGKLTQQQADALEARLQAGDLGALWGRRGHRGIPGVRGDLLPAMADAVAAELGISTDELREQLRGGQTLAQIAEAHGTTEQAVTDAAIAAARTQLAQAVADGKLTQEQADAIIARLEENGLHFDRPRGPRPGRPGAPGRTPAPDQAPPSEN